MNNSAPFSICYVEDWPKWNVQLLEAIEKRDGEAAANILVQSLRNEEFSPEDERGYEAMFEHLTVLEQSKVLWMYMEPLLVPELSLIHI